jgi:hypothetical protein
MNLTPVIRHRYFDANGLPLAGGKLYTYLASTTTPQATYTDSTGGTANTNPIILDSAGYCSMWVDPALSYKFVLANSSDVVQWTVDGVIGALAADSVATSSIQNLAVTTAKIADDAVTSDKLRDDAAVDANRAVTTNHIRNNAVTTAKILDYNVTRPKMAAGSFGVTDSGFIVKSADFTASVAEDFYLCSSQAGAITATLPAASGNKGKIFTFKKRDSSVNLVTIDGNAGEVIDDQLTYTLQFYEDYVTIICDGSNWQIIGRATQSWLVGSGYYGPTASLVWSRSSGTLGAFTADTDAIANTIELNPGPGTIRADDDNECRFEVDDLPAGTYEITFSGSMFLSDSGAEGGIVISDGTDQRGSISVQSAAVNRGSAFTVIGHFKYTSGGNKTFTLFGAVSSGTISVDPNGNNKRLHFSIKRIGT